MSEPVSIERLLLPEERVLWEGRARERPLGPIAFDAAVYFGCIVGPPTLLVFAFLLPIALAIGQGHRTQELLIAQGGATLGLLLLVLMVVWAGRGLVRSVRKRVAMNSARYYVTTRRALRIGVPLEEEKLVPLVQLAAAEEAVERAGTSVRLLSAKGEVLVAFDDLEDPAGAAEAIARALRAAPERSSSPPGPSPEEDRRSPEEDGPSP
ncbi:MAG TPA: hypothetical protein VFF73_23145 [Planctomycetota bacterium]|nr:hypothetical protein [Planctomycetota bacterium]